MVMHGNANANGNDGTHNVDSHDIENVDKTDTGDNGEQLARAILTVVIRNKKYSDLNTPFCAATLARTGRRLHVFGRKGGCFHTIEMTVSKKSGASRIDDSQNMNSGKINDLEKKIPL